MAKLEPIDMERVLEDLHIVTSALDYLGGVDGDESLPLPQWILGASSRSMKRNFSVLDGQGEEASRDFASELPDSPMELYREEFGHAWDTMVTSVKRIGIILEHGEVDLLDCDDNTRELLSALWENLEALPSKKPACRKQHPQKLRREAEEGVGKRLKRILGRLAPPQAPDSADKSKKIPTDPQLVELLNAKIDNAEKLKKGQTTVIALARKIMGGNETNAQSLTRALRRSRPKE